MASTSSGDWTAGYVADIGYTHGYYFELNPLRAALALNYAGLAAPRIETACELGFGQGVSINVHAAASQTGWHGTDFNPSQASNALDLGRASGADVHLTDEAFADFCNRPDLPDFDFISLHGIWSWISDDNRQIIADFVRRKLKVGGVLYVSYNTLPGWANGAPLRHLMAVHAQQMGSSGAGTSARVESALGFVDKVLASKPAFAAANPQAVERFNKLKTQNRNYLAHEYFNRDWHPMYFADMADWLAPSKMSFAASAHLIDAVDSIHVNAEQLKVIREATDPVFRETLRDFMVNQQFRRDYWVKGPRTLSAVDKTEALRTHRIVLTTRRDAIPMKVTGVLGEAELTTSIYGPLLDLLADGKARSLGEIEQALAPKGITLGQIAQAALILTGTNHAAPAQEPAVIAKARKATQKLNAYLLDRSRGSGDVNVLASPVTGGGVHINRFQQLFLLAYTKGRKQPAEWVEFAWAVLNGQGQKLVKDGNTLESNEDNIAELQSFADYFNTNSLPVLKALDVI